MELEKIKTNRYVWHVAHQKSLASIKVHGLRGRGGFPNIVVANQFLNSQELRIDIMDEYWSARFEFQSHYELALVMVRIDTHRLLRQWYYYFDEDFPVTYQYLEDGKPDPDHQEVCVVGSVPREFLDFYTFSDKRARAEFQVLSTSGASHIAAMPYAQKFESFYGYNIYLNKLD